MAVKLNRKAYEHAKKLAGEGKVARDERDDWSEHQPSADQENEYLKSHGWEGYARWYLGVDDEANEETKGHYKFPYGDFKKVHRCGVISAESRAAQYKHYDIEKAAAHVLGMIDERER